MRLVGRSITCKVNKRNKDRCRTGPRQSSTVLSRCGTTVPGLKQRKRYNPARGEPSRKLLSGVDTWQATARRSRRAAAAPPRRLVLRGALGLGREMVEWRGRRLCVDLVNASCLCLVRNRTSRCKRARDSLSITTSSTFGWIRDPNRTKMTLSENQDDTLPQVRGPVINFTQVSTYLYLCKAMNYYSLAQLFFFFLNL